jgi:hypothetical protein
MINKILYKKNGNIFGLNFGIVTGLGFKNDKENKNKKTINGKNDLKTIKNYKKNRKNRK